MQLGAFTADVIVDGKALEQYDIVSESPTKVTCWIASEEGKSFKLGWTCHESLRRTGIRARLHVDGIRCAGANMSPGRFGTGSTDDFTHFVNHRTKRKLMFTRALLSDDDSLLEKEVSKSVGEIQLTIQRGSLIRVPRTTIKTDVPVLHDNRFHERTKKSTVHCIGFGPEIRKEISSSCYRSRLIPNNDPVLTFVFKYRPLSILQANGIAPRPISIGGSIGSHENNFSECGVESGDKSVGSSEDIKPAELNDRIQSLENELKRLRDLQSGVFEERKPKRIKREERRQALSTPGEIIDLT